jgi:hypothetical protein
MEKSKKANGMLKYRLYLEDVGVGRRTMLKYRVGREDVTISHISLRETVKSSRITL